MEDLKCNILKRINFLTSSNRTLANFGIYVKEGKITENEFNKIFDKNKKKIPKKKQ